MSKMNHHNVFLTGIEGDPVPYSPFVDGGTRFIDLYVQFALAIVNKALIVGSDVQGSTCGYVGGVNCVL